MQYSFLNDYNEFAHERILEAIARENREQGGAYGQDTRCEAARRLIQTAIGRRESAVHFLVGGTQVNTTFIAAALRPHQGAVSAETGHINAHETGAIEASGHKVLALPQHDGKLLAAEVEEMARAHYADASFEHTVQPGLVYISQPTEVGTLYSKQELMDLRRVCDEYHMALYVDGARLGCALVAAQNNVSLHDLALLTDAFTIGGTKNGALFGEALVINNRQFDQDFRYCIKQRGGMLAKGRLLGVQFEALFSDGLYLENARHAVDEAQRFAAGVAARGYQFLVSSPTNQIFPILPRAVLERIRERFAYTLWSRYDDTHDVARFCTSWATPPEQVDALLEMLPHA